MDIINTIGKAFFDGYATADLNITTMFLCMSFTALISLYICIVYKLLNRNSFFDRNYHLSLFALAIITSMVILTIQSNIVVSLGMVGALSIVRFRTAVKNPMDLIFLFWSIAVGIICGAGFAMIAVIGSIVLTIGLIIFFVIPGEKETMILVINCVNYDEDLIIDIVNEECVTWKVRARNINTANVNLAIEVKPYMPKKLLSRLQQLDIVSSVSLVEHDGDVTA